MSHHNACHHSGPSHYDCARRRIDMLEGLAREVRRAVLDANVSITMPTDAYDELPRCSLVEFIDTALETGSLKCMKV